MDKLPIIDIGILEMSTDSRTSASVKSVRKLESLQAVALFRFLSNDVQNSIHKLNALCVTALSQVVLFCPRTKLSGLKICPNVQTRVNDKRERLLERIFLWWAPWNKRQSSRAEGPSRVNDKRERLLERTFLWWAP